MELDGQGIERRDFPISRRGYDPGAVDAHLRAVASAVDELRRQAQRGESLGANAASQVQGILEAAEATAADIVSGAEETARRAIESAELDARRTRDEAVSRAEAHVAAVAETTAALRGRVEGMDGELRTLIESLRGGTDRLSGDLTALERDMGALYDAASSRAPAVAPDGTQVSAAVSNGVAPAFHAPVSEPGAVAHDQQPAMPFAPAVPQPHGLQAELANEDAQARIATPADVEALAPPRPALAPSQPAPAVDAADALALSQAGGADLDGARLVALNMALNGDPREATDKYLADNFDLPERAKLIDEVYAAIDG